MSEGKSRRKWSAAEKLRIVMAGLDRGTNLSALCRQEGINLTQYYSWKKQLQSSSKEVFDKKTTAQEAQWAAEVQRLRNVIAEITAENLELKGALGLEDYGQLPVELQARVHDEVEQTKRRSGWPVKKTLAALCIPERSYYRWRKSRRWQQSDQKPASPVQPYEALEEERQAVIAYALKHPELRHREMAWRMVDEGVAYVSASTVYRILREKGLVCPWRRRTKRQRAPEEKALCPDQRWGTDLMYLHVLGRHYYYVGFLDEYSRYVVHEELLNSMDGPSVSLAAERAIETLKGPSGELTAQPEIRSDHGSGYVSGEFRQVLQAWGLSHVKIKPHCPEENGLMERSNRTVREAWEQEETPQDVQAAERLLGKIVHWYNHERLHSALGYLRPVDYYRGNPQALQEARRTKLAQARHRRREKNLGLRQRSLPL